MKLSDGAVHPLSPWVSNYTDTTRWILSLDVIRSRCIVHRTLQDAPITAGTYTAFNFATAEARSSSGVADTRRLGFHRVIKRRDRHECGE